MTGDKGAASNMPTLSMRARAHGWLMRRRHAGLEEGQFGGDDDREREMVETTTGLYFPEECRACFGRNFER